MRKTKASAWTIPTYHAFRRGKITYNGIEYRGTFYTLSDKLTDAQKEDLQDRHGNIAFFMSQSQYAPEQHHNVLFVADKNIKEETKVKRGSKNEPRD